MNLVQTAEFDELPWQTKDSFFLHAISTLFWLNIAFIVVHSGERCGLWASGFYFFFISSVLSSFPNASSLERRVDILKNTVVAAVITQQ